MRYLILLLLLAAPLSAQDTTLVVLREDTTIVNIDVHDNDTTFIHLSIQGGQQSLNDAVAALPCNECGGSSTASKIRDIGLVLAAFWFIYEYKNKENVGDTYNDGDVTQDVTVSEREKRKRNDDHGES